MQEKHQKKLDTSWKTLTLIGTIMAAGFAGATYLGKYQTTEAAESEHEAIIAAADEAAASASERAKSHEVQLQDITVRNVRIEVGQQQVLDEMRAQRVHRRRARTREEREAQQQELEDIDRRIDRREQALDRSYEQRPIVPPGAGLPNGDPLSGLEGL